MNPVTISSRILNQFPIDWEIDDQPRVLLRVLYKSPLKCRGLMLYEIIIINLQTIRLRFMKSFPIPA